jgi:hypothetical protein
LRAVEFCGLRCKHLVRTQRLLAAGLGQVSGTLDAVVAVALAIFFTGFVLGALWRSWVGRRHSRQEAAAELKRKARA